MEMEVRGEENESSKRDMQEKVAQFKKTLASLRRDLEETKREEEKAALFEVRRCLPLRCTCRAASICGRLP
jgi:hypothetical protein